MFVTVAPISGRIVMRPLVDGSGSLLGVLRVPVSFIIRESAGYLLRVSGSLVRVYDIRLDNGPPADVDGYGINASLASRQWPVFIAFPDLMLVRFVAAFPKQNAWAVYGATRHLPVASANSETDHVWFNVGKEGQLEEIAAPAEGIGTSCAQLLTDLCVWPDAYGKLHCLAQHPSRWRPVYLRLSELTAQVGEGTLSEKEFYRRVKTDAELRQVAPLSLDLEFARYLARMKAEGGLHLSSPMTAEQKQAQEELAGRILREMGAEA